MRRLLLVIILAAGVMSIILHCNLWRTNDNWSPHIDVERKEELIACAFKSNISVLLNVNKLYPFLCAENFLKVSELHGSHRIELPYGIKRAERYFQLALSRLPHCELFGEDDGMDMKKLGSLCGGYCPDSSLCKKCVVVGNGGVLRNKRLGETIDSYDVIIRMNNGPVIGYEEDVGRRTTFRLFYPESVFSDPVHHDPNTTAVLVVFKPHDLKWLWDVISGLGLIRTSGFWKKPAMRLIYSLNQIRILDPAITKRAAHEWLHLPTRFTKQEVK
uniref:Uncharacterized protein n=1 Tax=Sphaerodactylus townsendi TaxID=933632 RepID=A0ACB8FH06_9SAUR